MKKILMLPVLFISLLSFSQTNEINIVPEPVKIKIEGQKIKFDFPFYILFDKDGNNSFNAKYLQVELLKKNIPNAISLPNNLGNGDSRIVLKINKPANEEKYDLIINDKTITIIGSDKSVFYGIQTLLQILPTTNKHSSWVKLPENQKLINLSQLSINDYPRFPYRGMHLDVGRHFFPAPVIKKYIDYLAYHKFNTFHWHLTEDQGWRIEIKKYPKLTSVGAYRNGTIIGRNPGKGNDNIRYGGYYTQAEIKDIVKYAADRYITIIPEIEMPGHSSAAIAAYPELSCFPNESTVIRTPSITTLLEQRMPTNPADTVGKRTKLVQESWGVFEDVYCPSEFTFHFLEDVLDEVMELFPSKYIHIGGDECPKANWKRSEFCQNLIKEKGLKDEHGLQSYFIQRIERYLNSKGRNIIGWDEILEGGLAPNATVMSWRGEEGGIAAAKEKHNVIMTPEAYCYLNFSQTRNEDSLTYPGYLPLEKVYNYEPVPKELNAEQSKYILGAQGNVWTEYINNPKLLEYQVFPRMSALSEVLWNPKEKRDIKDFEKRLPAMYKRYEQWGASYSKAQYDLQSSVLPSPNNDGVLWKLETNEKGKIIYTKGKTRNATFNYSQPILINQTGEYEAILTDENHKLKGKWQSQKFSINKATGKKITLKDQPSERWQGNGAFTLVNGIITEKKLDQPLEWLGFQGKDLDAVIDLGKEENINKIRLNVLNLERSRIYSPSYVEVQFSHDGNNFYKIDTLAAYASKTEDFRTFSFEAKKNASITQARYVRVIAKNYGTIPEGKPGAGTATWLLADEIEVE